MTVHLIDGKAGKPHISGADLGDVKLGMFGRDGYVLDTGEKLAATLNSANSVTIGTGSAIMPTTGRHVRVPDPEILTVISGTQGQKRNDLIVLRATTDDSGTTIEGCSIVVIKGEATTGVAADPATESGDLVLYRVPIDGVSVSTPVALFDVLMPMSSLWESISQTILYEGRTNDTFTLRDSVANYRRIEVDVVTNDDDNATFGLNDPDGKSLGVTMTHASPDDLWVKAARWSFSGTTALKSGHGEVQANGSNAKNGQANIYVTKVIGYR